MNIWNLNIFFYQWHCIDLTNTVIFLNVAFCSLILLSSCSSCPRNSIFHSIYCFKNDFFFLKLNTLWIFLFLILALNKVLCFYKGVCICFFIAWIRNKLFAFTKRKFFRFYVSQLTHKKHFFWPLFFQLLKNNHY